MSIAIARGWQSAALPPTYRAMAILPPMVGPRAALRDLTAFMRQRSREQIIGAALAVLVTMIIVIIFFVYVENFPANRTDEQIVADQTKASEDRKKAEEARRQEFEKLQKQLGIE